MFVYRIFLLVQIFSVRIENFHLNKSQIKNSTECTNQWNSFVDALTEKKVWAIRSEKNELEICFEEKKILFFETKSFRQLGKTSERRSRRKSILARRVRRMSPFDHWKRRGALRKSALHDSNSSSNRKFSSSLRSENLSDERHRVDSRFFHNRNIL